MSGICGVLLDDPRKPLGAEPVLAMAQAQSQESGHALRVVADSGVALGAQAFGRRRAGVARLSASGASLLLAFHGTLYRGSKGDGGPDGEGAGDDAAIRLLRSYLEKGTGFLAALEGEFSIAVYDGRSEALHLATDPFRIHPLFYSAGPDGLVFASRMKGILARPPARPRVLHPEAIVDVLESSFTATPKSVFRDVAKLPPGNVLTYHRGRIRLDPYWDVDFRAPARAGKSELERRVRETLEDAIGVRLEEDGAPGRVGSFLSGGIDSSTVTLLLCKMAGEPVRCFSIGFAERPFNEMEYARIAARAAGATHHEYFVSPRDVRRALPTLIEAFDEPFGNASAVPTYYCARLAREHGVEVMYAGDGGDELFAGNERYATRRLFDAWRDLPGWLREPVLRPLVFAFARLLPLPPLEKARKYILRASIPYPDCLTSYGFFRTVPLAGILSKDFLAELAPDYDPSAAVRRHYRSALAETDLDRQLYLDLKLAISDNDLFKVTRATEAAGITVRYPFLDRRVAEAAAAVPAALKMRGRRLRSFFKDAYKDLLPEDVRRKRKHGFGLPIAGWLRTDPDLAELMHDLVLSARTVARGYFRREALEELVRRHASDTTSFYGTALWNLMILELWQRRYLDDPGRAA